MPSLAMSHLLLSDVPTDPMATIIPPELYMPIPLFLAYAALYRAAAPRLHTEKQRAYILSAVTSFGMTLMSLPFTAAYAHSGLAVAFEQAQHGWRAEVVRFGTIVFGVYLVADLGIGYVKYRSQIGLLTGWTHHSVYTVLMMYLLSTRLAPVFMIGAIMELPTFDLGISTLFPSVRSDERFLSSFLLIRILFHAKLLVDCAKPASRRLMDGSWVPTVALTLALVLHVSWFQAGVRGYLTRHAKARSSASPSASRLYSISRYREEADDEALEDNVYEQDNELDPQTPDDSPLITPRTPGTSPFPLGALSNLSLPSIPTMQLPPAFTTLASKLPRTAMNMQSGFKNAVRDQWEGQRERFESGSMMSSLGRLRRRRVSEEEYGGDAAAAM